MGFPNGGGGSGSSVIPIAFGTAAARPAAAAGNANTGYFATDTQEVSFSDGATWHLINQIGDGAQAYLQLQTLDGIVAAGDNAYMIMGTGGGGQPPALRVGGSTPQLQLGVAGTPVNINAADLDISSAGRGIRVAEGANAKQGTATLVAGTVVVANTAVTANSRIFLTPQDNNTTGTVRVSARVAGTSFTILSTVNTDTGVIAYEIFEPG